MITKSKQELGKLIQSNISKSLDNELVNLYSVPISGNTISRLIMAATMSAVWDMLEHAYSNEDFEKDIGLDT